MPDSTSQEFRDEAVEGAMRDAGVALEEVVYEDYFGFEESRQSFLPDGTSYVEFKIMTEGDRRQYLNAQNKKVTIKKGSGDAELELAQGDDKYNLLKLAITSWNLRRRNSSGDLVPVPFNRRTLEEFLNKTNPIVIDGIHKDITLAHPWLLDEMTVADIDKAIEDLQEMRVIAERREAGE